MGLSTAAGAEDYVITLKNNQFSPKELTLTANQKVKITVKNEDAAHAEFESYDMHREKVITGKGEIVLYIGPLDPGHYAYFDDFHRDTTTGTIISK